MPPTLHMALVVIVFAGGPHTATRYALFEERLPDLRPDAVFLTGADFPARFAERIEGVPVFTDQCHTTITSCVSLSSRLRKQYPDGARLLVMTSNYHAPRVAWLLRGMLPGRYRVTMETCRDMTWQALRTTRLSRRLLWGEITSWIYCAPAGLLPRLLPAGILLLPAAWFAVWRRRKHMARSDHEQAPPANRGSTSTS